FNLWLIFTQGSPQEKRKAKYLTIFLENFYGAEEIQLLAQTHFIALINKKVTPNKAALLTKALAQSRYVKYEMREALITETLNLENIADDIKCQLPLLLNDVLNTIYSLINKKEFSQAFKIAVDTDQEDGFLEYVEGCLSLAKNDMQRAEKHLLTSIQKG